MQSREHSGLLKRALFLITILKDNRIKTQTFSEEYVSCVQLCKTQIKTHDVRVLQSCRAGRYGQKYYSISYYINICHNIDLALMGKEMLSTFVRS